MIQIPEEWKVGNIQDIDINKPSVPINFLDDSILIKQTKKITEQSSILEIKNGNISFKNKQHITKDIEEIHRLSLIATNKDKNSGRTAIFLLMNPSQAIKDGDLTISDYTVNKCLYFANNCDYSKVIILNCSPFYASNGIDGEVMCHLREDYLDCQICNSVSITYISLLLTKLNPLKKDVDIFIGTGKLVKDSKKSNNLKMLYINIMNEFDTAGYKEFYCSLNDGNSLTEGNFAVHPGRLAKGHFCLNNDHLYKWDKKKSKLVKLSSSLFFL